MFSVVKGFTGIGVSSDTIKVSAPQTVKNETFQSVPEVSGTYRGSFDVKSISSVTSEDFSDV